MFIGQVLNKMGVNPDDIIKPGCYNVNFVNEDGNDDQTQFDIYPGQRANAFFFLWNDFARENDLCVNIVESIEFAGADEEMQTEINDIFKNGLVIIRDVNEEAANYGNVFLSPLDINLVLEKVAAAKAAGDKS